MTKNQQYLAYRLATQTVAPTRQIVLLYEGAIRYMQQAKEAVARKDIVQRYNLLVKAGEIIMGLQNSLDFETEGDIARILHDFYARVDMEILSVHRSNSLDMCEHVIRQLKKMRDAWEVIDQSHAAASKAADAAASPPPETVSPVSAEMLASIAFSA